MSRPTVSIIIVNWNGKDVTLECLASLQHLRYHPFQVIVVDNGSSDGSVEAFRGMDITLLEMKENLGFAGGTNAGMQHALHHGTDLLLLLNNDTTVEPSFLSHLVDRLMSDPLIGMVAPKIFYADEPDRLWFVGGEISMWKGTMRHRGIRELDRGQYDTACAMQYASGCCILTSARMISSIGFLDTSYAMYSEDADWSFRCRRAGYTILLEPRARIWHKISVASGGHLSSFKMKNKFFGNLRFFSRHASWYHWLVFPWMNVIVNLLAALRYVLTIRVR
jgi:GT2 family glycosyltransferase